MSAPDAKPDARLARADDYVSGHLGDAEAAAFEDELFAAVGGDHAADSEAVAAAGFVDTATRLLGTLHGFAELLEGATHAHVDQLRAAGARIHFFELGAGVPVSLPKWGADVDIVVARLNVDLRAHGLVDVEVETADGRPVKTFREVACDPADGALYAICQEPLARLAFTRGRTISRVISTKSGRRETVAVFDVDPG
ncbi:MAG TPA: hypothetical protein VHK47_08855 [Polyangia bacterium]|nr:hypothetical protein [Polyangia bacterium]